MIRQRTPEWYAARREGVTSTDMVAILGLSKYQSEGDVARDKQGAEPEPHDAATERRFRLGHAMERLIQTEEEVEHGVKLRHVDRLITSKAVPWALTSLDFERIGERTIVEAKASASRRWDDGLPEDVEAQVRWQMGVAGYPKAHVAALRYGSQLACFDVEHDEATFQQMVAIGADFRRRLAQGGPFDENHASVRRAHPLDDGTTMIATEELIEAVRERERVRVQQDQLKEYRDTLETAIQTKMGPSTVLLGPDFRVTWRRAKDSTTIGWEELANAYRKIMDDWWAGTGEIESLTNLDAIQSIYTTTKPGSRRFIVKGERDA